MLVHTELSTKDGLLMRGYRIVIPLQMQFEILDKLHNGHLGTVEPVYNGHLETRYIWPVYTGGCYRENLYKVVCSILVAMTVINE